MSYSAHDTEPEGVRSYLNRHPLQAACGLGLVLVVLLVFRFRPEPSPRASYSTDDGATYFSAPYRVPPFDEHGSEAVQVMLYSCDGGKTPFVGYLMRFTPEGKSEMEERLKHRTGRDQRSPLAFPPGSVQVKRPGAGSWVSQFTPQETGDKVKSAIRSGHNIAAARAAENAYEEIVNVKCPHGNGIAVPLGAD